MPYFPETIMPLTPKQDSVGVFPVGNSINASEFNLIDEEVQAVEKYLLGEAGGNDLNQKILDLVGKMNAVALRGSVSNVTSGYCLTGMRLRFPEVAATWLTKSPSKNDKEIKVNTTRDFPSSGVISIINDLSQYVFNEKEGTFDVRQPEGTSSVEWITYEGKTSDSFLNCNRGYMGTVVSTHDGYYQGSINTETILGNLLDHCPNIPLTTMQQICQRRMNRPYVSSQFPMFGISGTIDDMIRQLMMDGSSYRIYPTSPYLQRMRDAFSAITPDPSTIISTTQSYAVESWERIPFSPAVPVDITDNVVSYGIWREKWRYNASNVLEMEYAFLRSEDFSYASEGHLTGLEAYNLMQLALASNSIEPYTYQGISWPEKSVPVFNGRLNVSLNFSQWTNKADSPETARVVLLADGTVLGYLASNDNFDSVDQSVIGYSITLLPGY